MDLTLTSKFAQVKLGLQQLRLLVKANKRFIEMKKEDFEEREGL
jgi:hypothetical protein